MVETLSAKNENGLIGVLRILWKRRVLIVVGTAAVTIAAIIIALLLPKEYMSKAVVSLSAMRKSEQDELPKAMEIPVFRRYADTFQNLALFIRFSDLKRFSGDWDFGNWEFDEDFFEVHCKPVYAFETEKPGVKIAENSVIGIRLEVMGNSPAQAVEKAGILGQYLLTTILNMQIGHYVEATSTRAQIAIAQLEKAILTLERETVYLKETESLLENQLLKLPGISQKTDRELVNATENTAKYLSPQQQLVAVKMSIKENHIQRDRNMRNIKLNRVLSDFLANTAPLFQRDGDYMINDGLLSALVDAKEKFFAGKGEEEYKLAAYTLDEDLLRFQKLQSIVYKFISGPTHPQSHFKPKRKRIVIGAFFLGFFAFVFLALLAEAWNGNKKGGPRPVRGAESNPAE